MNQKFSYTLITVLLITAGVACAVGVGVGLWSVLGRAGAATLLVRGLLALLLILALSLIPALVMAHSFARSIREVSDAMQQIRRGNFTCDPRPRSPAELVELANEVRELGFFLQEHDRKIKQTVRADSRTQTQEALKRFGHGVAREIQKSLAGVLGYVEIAQRQPGVLGQLKNYMTLIDQEARAAREALERILRYVRDEEFPTEPLDVNALMMETSRGFLETTEQQKIKIQLNLGQDIPKVLGDAGQLKYALTSLIDNARESMLPDGGTLHQRGSERERGRHGQGLRAWYSRRRPAAHLHPLLHQQGEPEGCRPEPGHRRTHRPPARRPAGLLLRTGQRLGLLHSPHPDEGLPRRSVRSFLIVISACS